MAEPCRIQQSRTKGWRLPPGARSVARPSMWGNPFRVGLTYLWVDGAPCPYPTPTTVTAGVADCLGRLVVCDTADQAVTWYEAWITRMVPSMAEMATADLAGRDLACWCPLDEPCHAWVLLKVANQGGSDG